MRLFALLLITLSFAPAALAKKITTTEDLVQQLQKKYAKSWYKTATFVQKTTNIDKDGNKKVDTWFEAMSVPGSLRAISLRSRTATEFSSPTIRSMSSRMARSTTGPTCIL